MKNNATGAFTTHQHYLEAFAYIATNGYIKLHESYANIKKCTDGQRPPIIIPKESEPREQLRRALINAWGTELLLFMGHRFIKEDDLIRISNNWNIIQAYYAIYHAMQSIIIAKGIKRPESHPGTQNLFTDYWSRLSKAFSPWSLSYGSTGCNYPDLKIDTSVHQWKTINKDTCYSIACKALQTTRNDAIIEKYRESRENKRKALRKAWLDRNKGKKKQKKEPKFRLPLLTVEEKNKINEQTRCYTIMDYLYRLRIRCNYVDASMFTDGPKDEFTSTNVRSSILKIVSMTLFITELMLCSTNEGKIYLTEIAIKWCEANIPKEMIFGVGERIRLWE